MKNVLKKLINYLKEMKLFTTSYSINVFLEPLSEEEENKYINLLLEKNKDARNKLIEHNLRLVAHIVKKYENKNISADDLISIGTIGLIKAIDSYSKDKGVKLTTYAAKCIENEILMYFRSNKKYNNVVSLNDIVARSQDGSDISLIDVLEISDINVHDKIELKIIKMRYGLFNEEEKTQKEIAKNMKISRSYVSRIEKRSLVKILREFIKNNNI